MQVYYNVINRAVFLNVSGTFEKDPQYGEIMRRFRIANDTKEDAQHKTQGISRIQMLPFHQLQK